MVSGDFVVAHGSIDNLVGQKYDENLNNGRVWITTSTGTWTLFQETFIIRAVVQYSSGEIEELTPMRAK